MGFVEAVKSGFSKTLQFSGRSSRSEFWWFQFFLILSLLSLGLLFLAFAESDMAAGILVIIFIFYILWILVINVSLMTRRFHDIGYSGVWTLAYFFVSAFAGTVQQIDPDGLANNLIGFLPYLYFFYLWCTAGESGPNKYGNNPLENPECVASFSSAMENQSVDPEQVVLNVELGKGQLNSADSEHKELQEEEDSDFGEKKSKPIDESGSIENVENRLAKVQELLERGLITEEQAAKKRESLLNEI